MATDLIASGVSARLDLSCEQGVPFGGTLKIWSDAAKTIPLDLTDFNAYMAVSSSYFASSALWVGTDSDGIILGGSDGTLAFRLEAEDTRRLPARGLVYDIRLVHKVNLANVIGVCRGVLEVAPEARYA